MSTTTGQGSGPGLRLPQPVLSPRRRRGEIVRGLLSALVLLALVVAVPVGLVRFVGWPLPTSGPSREWLTTPFDGQLLLDVFACVVWLAWAYFVVCLLVEVRSERRHGGYARVHLGSGQDVARRLVAAVLLLVSGASVAAPSVLAHSAPVPVQRQVAQVAVTQTPVVAPAVDGGSTASATTASSARASTSAEQSAVVKLYDVKPRHGRHYECLWDIADTYLGNGLRYKEIVELNKGRMQPDGRTLGDPDLIYPGWVLELPADATGPGLRVVERVAGAALAPAPTAPTGSASAEAPGAAFTRHTVPVTADDATRTDGSTSLAPYGVAGAALAAGLLIALYRRRGALDGPADAAEAEAEAALRLAADLPLARGVDHALRDLSARLTEAERDLPQVYAVLLAGGELTLALSPAVADAPSPWLADPSGRSWTLPVGAELRPLDQLPGVLAPYPGLVALGVQPDRGSGAPRTVLVNLEAASGLVSLGGDLEVAREVAASVAVELATNLWSDDVRVHLVGFGDDLTAVAPDRMTRADDLDEVLGQVERATDGQRRALDDDPRGSVLRGRQVRPHDRLWRPELLVLSAPPTAEQAARLTRLAADTGRSVGALVVGDVPDARWRFVVAGDGTLQATVLGLDVQAQRLSEQQYRPVVQALADAERRAEQPVDVDPAARIDVGPAPVAPLADERLADPAARFPVEVRVLGPLEVVAPGDIDAARAELATEIVVAVALAPDGLHPNVLSSSIWPRGASAAVQEAAVGHVQRWLGADAAGRPRLRQGDDGRWRLADDVRVDWQVARAIVHRGDGRAADLAAVLAFVRGEAWTGLPAGRYAWLARSGVERDSRRLVVTVARRLAQTALADGDRELARDALLIGLRMVPTAEPLWRDLIRLEHQDGGPQAAAAAVSRMNAALLAHGVPRGASAETQALVDDVAPGLRDRLDGHVA